MDQYHNWEGDLFEDARQHQIEETKEQLDQLFSEIEAYRSSEKFKEILDFCVRFKEQSAFNAMLLNIQLPGCRYALTANQWRDRYDRKLQPNARPLIYLNHMPVGTLFDIKDTLPIDPDSPRVKQDEEIIQEATDPFNVDEEISRDLFDRLVGNMAYHGIAFDDKFDAASTYAANIRPYTTIALYRYRYYGKLVELKVRMNYLISVNRNANLASQFVSILHELGHFFCHHLPPMEDGLWQKRNLDGCIKEFEAEVTSYLVCKRHGFPCPNSVAYLEGYVKDKSEIPLNISVVNILRAVGDIEDLLGEFNYKDGLLYSKNKEFQRMISEHNKQLGRERK